MKSSFFVSLLDRRFFIEMDVNMKLSFLSVRFVSLLDSLYLNIIILVLMLLMFFDSAAVQTT